MVRAVASVDELAQFHKEVTDFCERHLVEGRDYGIIPGTGKRGKPSLPKPGAEKLAFAFGVYPRYELLATEADHFASVEWEKSDGRHGVVSGLYRYVVKCSLLRRQDGAAVAEGVGSCSTLESRYGGNDSGATHPHLRVRCPTNSRTARERQRVTHRSAPGEPPPRSS